MASQAQARQAGCCVSAPMRWQGSLHETCLKARQAQTQNPELIVARCAADSSLPAQLYLCRTAGIMLLRENGLSVACACNRAVREAMTTGKIEVTWL